jgi:hypothetical protein
MIMMPTSSTEKVRANRPSAIPISGLVDNRPVILRQPRQIRRGQALRSKPMSDTLSSRPASAPRLSLSQVTAQHETNLLGTVHGGVIMTLVG